MYHKLIGSPTQTYQVYWPRRDLKRRKQFIALGPKMIVPVYICTKVGEQVSLGPPVPHCCWESISPTSTRDETQVARVREFWRESVC